MNDHPQGASAFGVAAALPAFPLDLMYGSSVQPVNSPHDAPNHPSFFAAAAAAQAAGVAVAPAVGSHRNNHDPASIKPAKSERRPAAIKPRRMDVVLGRGRHGDKMEGNRRYRELLKQYRSEYEQARNMTADGKMQVVAEIMQILEGGGSRFLREMPPQQDGNRIIFPYW